MVTMASWYQSRMASKAPAAPKPTPAQTMYNQIQSNPNTAAYRAWQFTQNHPGFTGAPGASSQDPGSAASTAATNDPFAQALSALLAGDQNVEDTFTTPGGNTLSGSRGKKSGAGSSTLAKELQQKLQIMNLDEQNKLIQLQQQQDPLLFQQQLRAMDTQKATITENADIANRGISSSATASGAFGARGTQQARGDVANQTYNRLTSLDTKYQTALLNEDYNKNALQSQASMNFWERFAQAAQAGFFK